MTFPHPENPKDWQTAYTRERAYADSGKHASRSGLAALIGKPILLTYFLILIAPSINLERFRPATIHPLVFGILVWGGIFLALLFISNLLIKTTRGWAYRFVSNFFVDFYRPPENIDPIEIIDYRLHGKPKLPAPLNILFPFEYIIVRDGNIAKSDQWPAWSARNLGGPLLLIVFDGYALYLERGNRFSRVVGPGEKIPFLEWYETVKYVADLRPKVQEGSFEVWTKDGIKINLTARIEYRIGDPRKKEENPSLVYPFDPEAVKKAMERKALRWPNRLGGEPDEFPWMDAAWGQVTGVVPGYIGSRMFDDLFIADRKNGQILSPNALQKIFDDLNKNTRPFGVYVTDFQILEIKIPEEVEKHQKEYWKAEKQGDISIIEGQAKALNIRSIEKARAEAQHDLIVAIADGLRQNKDNQFAESVLLSFSEILTDSLEDPLLRAYLAKETLETLEKLQDILKAEDQNGS